MTKKLDKLSAKQQKSLGEQEKGQPAVEAALATDSDNVKGYKDVMNRTTSSGDETAGILRVNIVIVGACGLSSSFSHFLNHKKHTD